MALLAKRVSEASSPASIASSSVTPSARAAAAACSKIAANSSRIGAPDPDPAKPRGACAMPGAHHLLGLSLAAVGDAPQRPVLGAGDRGAGVPELRRDPAVARILQHAHAAAVTDLPADLAAELEVVALVVDRPAPVGLHVDRVRHVEDLIERLLTRQQAHVRHADERNARPAVGAHAAVGSRLADQRRRLARSHVAGEEAAPDDVGALRAHAFIVERERAKAGAVRGARVADDVHDLRPVAQLPELIEREEAHPRIVRFAAEHAIELDGVPDRFVNLQPELRAVEDQVELALRTLIRGVQRDGLVSDARSIFEQMQLVDQLIALELVLAAEGVGIAAPLDLPFLVAERGKTRAGRIPGLVDQAATARRENLPLPVEVH